MSKQEFDTHLRYGQGILIKGYKEESNGIMTTKGFADTRARFQTYDDILYFKNYRNAIFQVLPASSFDINDELRFLIENNIENTGNNLQILKAKAKSQHDQFDLNIKSKDKLYVCFGDQVVLKHIDSGTYLSGTIRPAQGKNGAFSVQVTQDLKASLIFRLLPYRSFQNLSNPIPLQSPILIQNSFNKGFLTFQRFGLLQDKQKGNYMLMQKDPIKSDQSYKIPIKTDSTNSQIYQCVTHFSDLSIQQVQQQMPWKFQLHFNDVENDNLIQHDIVYFQHTANNGVLAANGEQQIVLKQLKGQKTSQLCFYDCLWEIQQYKEHGPNSYILRHLMSGMTLGIDYVRNLQGVLIPTKPKLIDISDGKGTQNQVDKLGVIQLKLAKKQGGDIRSKSYINICYGERCLDMSKNSQRQSTKRDAENRMLFQSQNYQKQVKKQLIDLNKMSVMASNEFDYEIKKLIFTLDISKHCFVIQQIDNQLKSEVLFALSFHSRLINLREDLKWGAQQSEKKVTYLRMMQITQKTKQIKYFLKNTTTQDPNRQFKSPLPKRQIICSHLGISQLLFELLFFMRKNRDGQLVSKDDKKVTGPTIFQSKANQLQKFTQMYNAIYQVIFELIRDNVQFKIHVSKWISFIFEDVIRYNEEYQLKTLLQLLKNNSFFVNNFVNQQLVSYLVDRMLHNPKATHEFHEKKYLQIFRAFCICGDEVNSDNQVLILNKFIKRLSQDEAGAKYEIKLGKMKNKQGVQQIICWAAPDKNQAKWKKFGDYYKRCIDDYPSAWYYMVSYLHLIADMCRGRNKIVQSYIDTTMTLDVISQLMTSQQLNDAQAPIIRIMHYLYAESQNFYPIDRITRVVNFNQLQDQIVINSTKSEVRPKALLSSVMKSLIDKLQTYGPIEVKNVARNQCLLVILTFLKQTFILGFWQQKAQVQQIYNSISRLIQPQNNINYQQIKQQSQKPQIILMFNCKQKCMQILQLIIDLDIDYFLKHFCKTFKKYQIPTQKMQVQVSPELLQANQQSRFSIQFFKSYKQQNKQLVSIVSTDICPKIIQLSKHNHPRLTSSSLRILQRILDFDRHISNGFIDMIFVCESNRIDLHKHITDRRDKFFTLQYQNTTKINILNQKSLYFMMYRDEKDAGIMQDLYMISQLVKNENSLARIRDIKTLDSSGTFRQLAQDKLINFTSQRRSSNKMKQQVVDASDIHHKVLKYVFNCKQLPTENLAIKLLHLCYRFLVSIIQNYQQLKLTLIPYIPKMVHHIQRNIGCIDFLKQMYDNNRNMLYNDIDILKLIKIVCNVIQHEDIGSSFYKSKLLDFFRYLIYCNGRALSYNQIQILKIMQDDSFKNIIFDITPKRIRILVQKFNQLNRGQAAQGSVKIIKMQAQLTYIVTFFQIMVSLIDDKCKVNAGKLIKKFPFDKLVECIEKAQRCWPLKRNLRAFLNRLYYFQPQIQTYFSAIRTKQIQNIIRDLNYFIDIKCKANVAQFESQYFQNPVRFSYFQSYLYLNLQQNLFTLYQIVKNPNLVSEFKNYLHSAKNASKSGPYNFIKICQRLGWIRNYFSNNKNVFTTSFIKFLLNELRNVIQQFDDNIYSEGMMFGGDRVPTKQQKDKSRKLLIQKIMLGQISTFFVQGAQQVFKQKPLVYQTPPKLAMVKDAKLPNRQKLIRKLRQILTRTKRQFENKDDQINYKQFKLISALKLSKQMDQQFAQLYNAKLKQINLLNNKFKQIQQQKRNKQLQQQLKDNKQSKQVAIVKIKGPTSQFDTLLQYVSAIIQINSINPQVFSPQIKIFFLKMIIGIIQQSNKTEMQQKKPIDEWQGQDWYKYSHEIEKIQIRLKNGYLGTLIAEILQQNIIDNISLANSTLLCGIAYLLGGNQTTQKNLIQQIKKDQDNRVFRNIMNLINKLGKIILKNIDESNIKPNSNQDFQVNIIDNYDFYDDKQKYCLRKNVFQPSSTNQVIYHRECIVTYRRAFRFLQLLCQNNNIDNKRYIRDQPGKTQTVNFITVTTNELRNLFQVMCKQIVDVPLFLLDFLLQVTQIPVNKNQQALMNSSFFQDLCQMSNQFAKPGKNIQRNFEQKQNPLQQIYAKSVQVILSNFEGNDKNTYMILDSKLDPKFLVNILDNKFKSFEVNTKQQLLVYIKKSLQQYDENGNKIVRTMFTDQIMSIFDIITIFMKLNQQLGDSSRLYNSYLKFKQQSQDRADMMNHLQKSLIHIQINDSNNQKQTIYFPKQPSYYSLSDSIRDYVMSVVLRGTHRQKIVSLIGYTSTIQQSIQYSYRLHKSQGIVQSNMTNSYKYASIMSIVICIFMFMYYGVIIQYGDAQFTSNRIFRSIRFVLSLIQLSFSVCYAYYWLVLKVWYQPQYKPKQKDKQVNIADSEEGNQNANSQQSQSFFKNTRIYKWYKAYNANKQKQPKQTFYGNSNFYRLLLFVGASFIGTFIDPTFFFIHIIDIFCQSPLLANIFKAIANTVLPVSLVSFMGVIFVAVFCTVTFSNYTKDIYGQKQLKHPQQLCDSMLTCLLALYVSGSIGQTMQTFQGERFIYDTIYTIFFGMLFGNIISGIMLDAFSGLRESNQELQQDKQNFCYICNVQRSKLQKQKIKFKDHITQKHFLWNYVFYIISLNAKNQTDYTGLQYQIIKQYNQIDQDMQTRWIPQDSQDFDAKEIATKMIEKIDQINGNIQNGLTQLEQYVKQFNQNAGELVQA